MQGTPCDREVAGRLLLCYTPDVMRRNKNFDTAVAWVKAHYVIHPSLDSIKLVHPDGRAYGRFWSFLVRRDANGKLVKLPTPTITIANGRRPVYDFVNTIVHELTHLAQFLEGRPYDEGEAHHAGVVAAARYRGLTS